MSYIRHNAIVVTSWDKRAIVKAVKAAHEIGLHVLGPSDALMNGYCSILVCPDGSKEGWQRSDDVDREREQFRKWIKDQRYADGSSSFEWAEIAYGRDDKAAEVVKHEWMA